MNTCKRQEKDGNQIAHPYWCRANCIGLITVTALLALYATVTWILGLLPSR